MEAKTHLEEGPVEVHVVQCVRLASIQDLVQCLPDAQPHRQVQASLWMEEGASAHIESHIEHTMQTLKWAHIGTH